MYTVTQIHKTWKISKPKIEALLEENNATPVHEAFIEVSSMVYLKRYSVTAKYYQSEVIEDIFKDFEKRL